MDPPQEIQTLLYHLRVGKVRRHPRLDLLALMLAPSLALMLASEPRRILAST